MLIKGRKIKMIKKMPYFDKVGQEFEVTEVKNGAIYFKCNFGIGVMSYEEFKEYFKEIEEKWTDWKTIELFNVLVSYRVKGRKVHVRYLGANGYALCHEEDEFILEKGVELAYTRAKLLKMKKTLEHAEKEYLKLLEKMYYKERK